MAEKGSQGPAEFRGGRFPVEQDLGTKEKTSMDPQGKTGSGVPEHNTGGRFGSNLVAKDPTAHLNPKGRESPGIPTHVVGKRFGTPQNLPDKSPHLNPSK